MRFAQAFFLCSLIAGFTLLGWCVTRQTISGVCGFEVTGMPESVWLPLLWIVVSAVAVCFTSMS